MKYLKRLKTIFKFSKLTFDQKYENFEFIKTIKEYNFLKKSFKNLKVIQELKFFNFFNLIFNQKYEFFLFLFFSVLILVLKSNKTIENLNFFFNILKKL